MSYVQQRCLRSQSQPSVFFNLMILFYALDVFVDFSSLH